MSIKVNKTITISEELLKEVEAKLSLTPGLDFNTFIIQAVNDRLASKINSKPLSMSELKELTSRYVKDNSKGFGPQGQSKNVISEIIEK